MLSLHTNAASLSTQNALSANNKGLTSSMTKLGTGFRINSAMDDAAGLQIANRLKAQNSGMAVAMRNTQNGISLMQTAEGALNEVNTMLVRMKDLATQSADASASVADKEAMQAEYDSLASEITNIMGNTTFGGEKLMNSKVTAAAKAEADVKLKALVAELGEQGAVVVNTARVTTTTPPTAATYKYADKDATTTAYEGVGIGKEVTNADMALKVAKEAYEVDPTNTDKAKAYLEKQEAFDAAEKKFADKEKEIANATAYLEALNAAPEEDGKFANALNFQIGATTSESMQLDLASTLTALHTNLSTVSSKYTSAGISSQVPGTELTGTDATTGKSTASAMIDELQTVLDQVGEMRSALGAASNRLEHTNSNLGNMSSTTSAAIGRIMDVDYATETSTMTKNQMLMQASSAMLKQSNSMSQMVASLLQ